MEYKADILSLDYEGRGVAKTGGRTVFIANALPQETVRFRIVREKNGFAEAEAEEILVPSPQRSTPPCPHYGECGGCAMQHIGFEAQAAMKQRVFEEQLWRIGKTLPEQILPVVYGAPWHYRSRTRLAVETAAGGEILLGYQARRSRRVVGIDTCLLLPEHVSGSLKTIRAALQGIARQQPEHGIRSVEISVGRRITALNVIGEKPLPQAVLHGLSGSLNAGGTAWQVWQQIGANPPQAVSPENAPPLDYVLPEFGITMPFCLGDFTQINTPLNEIMVSRAVRLLNPQPHEHVADLFCGLGNFTLPLARRAKSVVGAEGAEHLVRRAAANALANGIGNARFVAANLFRATPKLLAKLGAFDKLLLDPPRAGAYAVVQALGGKIRPCRIVYVSCNPATLARDAAVLADKGYRFRSAGVMNLFPQTSHVEAVAVFEAA